MNDAHVRLRAPVLSALLSIAAIAATHASGQTNSAQAPAARKDNPTTAAPSSSSINDETIEMSPFEVKTDSASSYGALESNSLTAFRIDLRKMPATAQVFTRTFMDDIGARSIEDVLAGYAGTVTAASNNPAAALDAKGDRDGSQGLSIRGVSAGEIKRDGFIGPPNSARTATGYTDNFDIERVEVIEGPQSILYGSVGGGGVINVASKRAQFGKTSASLSYALDQYGSKRSVLDANYGKDNIAVRVAAVGDHERTQREKLGNDLAGIYAQIAFRLGSSTILRFYTEHTDNDARISFKPNLNPFLKTGDPRIGQDARYLALTGQLSDLAVLNRPLTYNNLESLASWFSDEQIKTQWNGMSIETKLGWGFSAQLTAIYTETTDLRITDGRTLLPAAGLLNAGANPFSLTAIQIGGGATNPVKVNQQRDRNKGARLAIVQEADFSLFHIKAHSQTAFGGQAFHRGPTFGSSGVAYAYYQADSNWNVVKGTGTLDYGRIPLQFVYFPVQNGTPSAPLFRPGTERITVNGVNYVLQPRILQDPNLVSPSNPFGLIPNNPTASNPNGYTDNWNRGGETHSGMAYAANFTDWFDGRLTTLAGYSLTRFETLNVGAGSLTPTPKASHPGWQVGANYGVFSWLRAYAIAGTAETAEASTTDIYGRPLKAPEAKSPTPEFGLKASTSDGKYSAQLNYSPSTKTLNENKDTGDTSFEDAINPNGINGRLGGANANRRVNLDRTLESASLVLTADPTHNWRMRFLVSHLDGKISKSVVYNQVYNDQFYSNNGIVTYKDGTPLLVDPAGGNGAKTQALTVAMINDPTSPYYARPDTNSGSITNTTLRTALTTADPNKGAAATGATGLPLSQMQYTATTPYPNGVVTIYKEGEKNTGFNEYTFNFQSNYTFDSGWLKNLSILTDVQTYTKNRAYYSTFPSTSGSLLGTLATRKLVRLPDDFVLNLGLFYSFKFHKHLTWTSQLNVKNVFNKDNVWVIPTAANGSLFNARLANDPRQYVWTNTISF